MQHWNLQAIHPQVFLKTFRPINIDSGTADALVGFHVGFFF